MAGTMPLTLSALVFNTFEILQNYRLPSTRESTLQLPDSQDPALLAATLGLQSLSEKVRSRMFARNGNKVKAIVFSVKEHSCVEIVA